MCKPYLRGNKCHMDCLSCPYELFSPDCVNSQLKDLTTLADMEIRTIRYEEEILIDFDERKTGIITEYTHLARQIEAIMANPETYGRKEDDGYGLRKNLLRKFYEAVFMNPLLAARILEEYNEAPPEKGIFMEGYKHFKAWVNGILERFPQAQIYSLTKETGDLRLSFLSLAGLKSLHFISSFILSLPPEAKPIDDPESAYALAFGVNARIYEISDSEANLYVQENPLIDGLTPELAKLLKQQIAADMVPTSEKNVDYETQYEKKTREYRSAFIDKAVALGIPLTPQQALAMARETANWTVGLGSPIENLTLDRDNITDIFIDGENSPLYVQHAKFGLCHTLWRYNKEMMEYAIKDVLNSAAGVKRFDESVPIIDMMMTRLNLRCHLQRPPATFKEIQLALRLTKETPFTYSQYLNLGSMSAFFAGYDNLLVSLGCSEAVLGLKGTGKTAFTSAKIIGIGTQMRILPIEDIEEIPVKAYRKRGFHIGTMKVQSSDKEYGEKGELTLTEMANASLRMGESCLIINEVRSRAAIQGIINLLNTQPGVFCLYNLHAQSIKDIQDRFELVFNVPAASMFATDRYTFLRKMRFGRKGRVYRIIGQGLETDRAGMKFVETFSLERGNSLKESSLKCAFIENPEARAWKLGELDFGKLEKDLSVTFVPPALKRRADDNGIAPSQYIMQAFFKGKIYSDACRTAEKLGKPELTEIDFMLKCEAHSAKMLKEKERENGSVDFKSMMPEWDALYKRLVEEEIRAK